MSVISSYLEVAPNPDQLTHTAEFKRVGKRIIGFNFGVTLPLVGQASFFITNNGKQVIPLSGNIFLFQSNAAVGYYGIVPVNVTLEGPPYYLNLNYTGTSGTETGHIAVMVLSTDDPDYGELVNSNIEKVIALLGG